MISGVIQSNEARIIVTVIGPQGQEHEVHAVIDTGFSGVLTLPPSMIAKLGLTWQTIEIATLADGSECRFDVYEAQLIWDGIVYDTLVDEADTDPLIGMKLLKGFELKMQVRPRGKVTIKRLRSK